MEILQYCFRYFRIVTKTDNDISGRLYYVHWGDWPTILKKYYVNDPSRIFSPDSKKKLNLITKN